jgi:hypothetical protein
MFISFTIAKREREGKRRIPRYRIIKQDEMGLYGSASPVPIPWARRQPRAPPPRCGDGSGRKMKGRAFQRPIPWW